MLPAIKAGFVAISAAATGVGSAIATYFLPVTATIAGVVLAVYLLKRAWETNFAGIRISFSEHGTKSNWSSKALKH